MLGMMSEGLAEMFKGVSLQNCHTLFEIIFLSSPFGLVPNTSPIHPIKKVLDIVNKHFYIFLQ
jgi:hypothetical protein